MPTSLVLLFIPTKYIKLSQTVWELWPANDFHFRGDNYITKTVRVVALARDTPTRPCLYFNQLLLNISKGINVMERTRIATDFCFRGDNYIMKKVRVVSLAYWPSSSSLPNIITLSQTIWELWPVQDFGFKGDNNITKIVLSLLHVTRLRALLFIFNRYYQNMSKDIKVIEQIRVRLRTDGWKPC